MIRAPTLACAAALLAGTSYAAALPDAAACEAAMTATERGTVLPARLLAAIGTVESGRTGPHGSATSWPWTINVDGVGHFYESKAEAMAAVTALQASGSHSIDVGCMQINLHYHPAAFAGLEEAFDPAANVRYGALFLRTLYASTGTWAAAIAAYHSASPDRGQDYSQRVAAVWPLATAYALPLRPANAGAIVAAAASRLAREPDVDPLHVATPEFRARLIAAAAFRRERNAMMGLGSSTGVGHTYADASIRSDRLRR